uniref:Protein krueppel n=1 Tax=Anopheles epiroticus TaxID=199890 RepID=A0A182PK31_9DIPT
MELLATMEVPTAGPETYCRLCLGKDSLLRVFAAERSEQSDSGTSTSPSCTNELVEKIYECTNIKLSSTVDAGCAICYRCLQAVQDFYHFRVRSNKVNDLIQVTTVVANGDGGSGDYGEGNNNGDNDEASKRGPGVTPTSPSKQATSVTAKPSRKLLLPSCPVVAAASRGERKYRCRYCPKSFHTETALTEHGKRTHVAGRQHHCPNCLAQFHHAPSLARHMRSRSCFAFSKYRCRVCSESFPERDQWANHIRIHAKDFPHQCPDCWSQFKHKATLRRHANTVHLLVKV